MKMKNISFIALTALICSSCSLFGIGDEEQPKYKVLISDDNKEIREYSPLLIAKTTVSGSFKEAQKEGFRILAGFIFGKNKSQEKIEMTSPVTQGPKSEKISMTAPVILAENPGQSWTMTFTMPSQYTQETLPSPDDSTIVIEKVEKKVYAVLRFTGFWGEERNRSKGIELTNWISEQDGYEAISEPLFAGYNPPWTLPFFRRNEMMVELRPKK